MTQDELELDLINQAIALQQKPEAEAQALGRFLRDAGLPLIRYHMAEVERRGSTYDAMEVTTEGMGRTLLTLAAPISMPRMKAEAFALAVLRLVVNGVQGHPEMRASQVMQALVKQIADAMPIVQLDEAVSSHHGAQA